ncbi:MAG: metalloregulator ArsR/SmtB family transcription factor [Anaerovorax sp.]
MNQLTTVFKAFSDETRLRILILLAQEELCVCQLSGIMDISQPKVSKHLSKLRDMGFVIDQRKERFVFYRLQRKNRFLMTITEDILQKSEEFPQLLADRCGLAEREQYLSQCNCNLDV